MLSPQQLQRLSAAPYENAAPRDLPDLSLIDVDRTLPVPARIETFLRNVDNPYLYRVGHTKVQIQFSNDGEPLQKILPNAFSPPLLSKN